MKLTSSSYFTFSGGEVHCKLDIATYRATITCMDYTMNGFMALAEHKEILDRKGLHSELVYPYFPYARQDRVMNADEPFSLRVFCQLLNSLKFNSVTIWDPHSDVTPALINNCHIVAQDTIVKQYLPKQSLLDNPEVLVVSPDAGAYKKISKIIKDDSRIVLGTKIRNAEGNVTSTEVYSKTDLSGRNCLIIDDICDGGRTFIELAKALREKGANCVWLYVTHGIFSKGLEILREGGISHIHTTNSFNHDLIGHWKDYVTEITLC